MFLQQGEIFSEDSMFNDAYLRMAAFSTCQLFGVRSIFEIAPYMASIWHSQEYDKLRYIF